MSEVFVSTTDDDTVERCLPCEAAREDGASDEFSLWLTRLVHDYRATLARIARAEGLLAEDAFDAVQEAFRAFIVRDDARELVARPDEARKVLLVLTRNLARNRRRLHAGARPHLSDASVIESLPDEAPTSEEVLESSGARAARALCGRAGRGSARGGHAAHARRGSRRGRGPHARHRARTRRRPLAPREGQPGHLHGGRTKSDPEGRHERKQS